MHTSSSSSITTTCSNWSSSSRLKSLSRISKSSTSGMIMAIIGCLHSDSRWASASMTASGCVHAKLLSVPQIRAAHALEISRMHCKPHLASSPDTWPLLGTFDHAVLSPEIRGQIWGGRYTYTCCSSVRLAHTRSTTATANSAQDVEAGASAVLIQHTLCTSLMTCEVWCVPRAASDMRTDVSHKHKHTSGSALSTVSL